MKRFAYLFLILLLPFLTDANDGKVAWQGPDRPVYVITQNHYAEGFTPDGDTTRFTDLIAIEIYNPNPRPAGQDATYNIGDNFSLFLGGQQEGRVKVEKVLPLQCDSSAAVVSADPSIKWEKGTMALATNASKVSAHANAQRPANQSEEKVAKHLAMMEFRRHGVPGNLEKDIQFEQAIVTGLDQGGAKSLIAYAFLKTKVAIYEAFLIGKLDDASGTIEFARYHETSDVEDGMDSQDYRFVDQLDLDGDGTDEIVVEVTGYESEEFRILKRVGGSWVRVHVGGAGGC